MSPASPIRGVQEDDLLLDRLGRRECVDTDGIGGVLQGWVTAIDADAMRVSAPVPVMRVSDGDPIADVEVLPVVRSRSTTGRLIRLSGSRLAAAAATAVLVSGASVAAALSGHEVPGVSTLLRTVTVAEPEPATLSGTPTESATVDGAQVSATLARSRKLLEAGKVVEAKKLIDEVRVPAAQNPGLMMQVTSLDNLIGSTTPSGIPTTVPAAPPAGTDPGAGAGGEPSGGTGAGPSNSQTSEPSPSGTGSNQPSPSSTKESTPDPKPSPTTGGSGSTSPSPGGSSGSPGASTGSGSGASTGSPGEGGATGSPGDKASTASVGKKGATASAGKKGPTVSASKKGPAGPSSDAGTARADRSPKASASGAVARPRSADTGDDRTSP